MDCHSHISSVDSPLVFAHSHAATHRSPSSSPNTDLVEWKHAFMVRNITSGEVTETVVFFILDVLHFGLSEFVEQSPNPLVSDLRVDSTLTECPHLGIVN